MINNIKDIKMSEKRFKKMQNLGAVREIMPHYDKLNGLVGIKLKDYCKKLNEKSEIKVLEIGCGSGFTTQNILIADKKIRLISIDNDAGMIDQTKKSFSKQIKNGTLKIKESDALEFLRKQKNESFEAIASCTTLHNFKKDYRHKALIEIFRILKKEGIFINADKYAKTGIQHDKDYKKQMNYFDKYDLPKIKAKYKNEDLSSLKKKWIKHYIDDNKEDRLMEEQYSVNEMRKIGFKNIKLTDRSLLEAVLIAKK